MSVLYHLTLFLSKAPPFDDFQGVHVFRAAQPDHKGQNGGEKQQLNYQAYVLFKRGFWPVHELLRKSDIVDIGIIGTATLASMEKRHCKSDIFPSSGPGNVALYTKGDIGFGG